MTDPKFVHLAVHTEYSLVDSVVRIPELIARAVELDMPAIGVTEFCNLFSVVRFYRAAEKAGIKPIIGADVLMVSDDSDRELYRTTLLAADNDGYRNLCQLVSRSFLEGQSRGRPVIPFQWLEQHSTGLIVLSGGSRGEIGQLIVAGQQSAADREFEKWADLFGDRFYLSARRIGSAVDELHLHGTLELAGRFDWSVVAVNDVRFAYGHQFDAHEARVCIHEGRVLHDTKRPREYTDQQFLRSGEEMLTRFADCPALVENSVEIAKRCNVELSLGTEVLPDFPVEEDWTEAEWFERCARDGLKARLSHSHPSASAQDASLDEYEERLNYELDVIVKMGFPGYYLIVADFIQWARENEIPVGPGRGSGAGSLAAYAMGITDLDPIEYDLLFERFLNPERVSMPDFDIDFCMEGRDRVIDYVGNKYGQERVSQIITFGTMAAKAVVRDVGRVLGHPYGFVDQIAKLVPFELGITLHKALADEPRLRERYDTEEDVRALLDLAQALEGLTRNAGRHAGGIVIAPGPLTDFTPLYCEQGSSAAVTQLDKDDVALAGLVKFDFLGLRTLTIIDWALRSINRQRSESGEADLDIAAIPTFDQDAYDLIGRGETTAVFQLESRGMRELILRLKPDCFEDIIALVALFRPGPLQSGMVDDFIERKHGRAKIEYPHPELESLLRSTYGVILYQEQVMQIAQVLAGYSLGSADILRKAMGKKQPEEMAKQREVFVGGASERGVELSVATYIFDLMEKFAGYGFNRSHSAAYALVSYQTAWLKAHYPPHFMAAVLSADMDNTDKVVTLIDECRTMDVELRPPSVNRCQFGFTVEDGKAIRYGLGAIKGLGRGPVDAIVHERDSGEPFTDLFEFCRRVDLKRVNRRALEALIRAGALDELAESRALNMATLTQAMQAAEQFGRIAQLGQDDLFGDPHESDDSEGSLVLPEVVQWSDEERLQGEKETLGIYLTGHPIERYRNELQPMVTAPIVQVSEHRGRKAIVAGFIVSMRTMNTRRGRMAVASIDDRSGRMEVVVYSEAYQTYRDLLAKDALIVAEGEVGIDDVTGNPSMVAERVMDLDGACARFARGLLIGLDATNTRCERFIDELQLLLGPYREGNTRVALEYRRCDAKARISFGESWKVTPTQELLVGLRELAGNENVSLRFR